MKLQYIYIGCFYQFFIGFIRLSINSYEPCESGYTVRVPSLKRSKKIWDNFYKLFPYIKNALMNNRYVYRFGEPTLVGDVYVCKEERVHGLNPFNNRQTGVGRRIRTTKFLKTW